MVFLFILITLYTFNWEPSVGNRVCRGFCVLVSYDINSGVTIGGLGGSLPRALDVGEGRQKSARFFYFRKIN